MSVGASVGFIALFGGAVWRDLEAWTVADREGTLGIFKAQTAGRRANVGLPIAQTILTEEERRRLPELFEAADLEPGAVLSSAASSLWSWVSSI